MFQSTANANMQVQVGLAAAHGLCVYFCVFILQTYACVYYFVLYVYHGVSLRKYDALVLARVMEEVC
jgi:hypothetical protein